MPLIYDVYNDSTHIHTQWLAEARAGGEEVPLKTFPISIGFNYEIQFFPPKFEVFVLQYQKIIV